MALSFSTGTINQPDAGSVGLAMVEKIRDDVVAHAAWDLVEEFTPASGTVRWYVFKNLAVQSGLPNDWYVVIGRILGSGELRPFICEGYNAGGHLASFFTPSAYSSQFTFDSNGQYTPTFILGTAIGSTPHYGTWAPSGTSTKWWLIVADDGFTVAFNGAANGFFHFGAYIPFTVLPVTMPIQMICRDMVNIGTGGITRNPAVAGVTTYGSALHIQGGQGSSVGAGQFLGFAGELRYNDKLQGNQRAVAEQGITIYTYQVTEIPAHGYILGKQKRMRVNNTTFPPGTAFGDAFVLQNRLWVPHTPTDGRFWDTGVAAS